MKLIRIGNEAGGSIASHLESIGRSTEWAGRERRRKETEEGKQGKTENRNGGGTTENRKCERERERDMEKPRADLKLAFLR